MTKIFISYRRDDTSGYAGRLYDGLVRRFGNDQVFMDMRILPGQNFVQVIEEAVGQSDALVALIGRQWLSISDTKGQRRIDDPDDFVRLEISTALHNGILVIPTLVREATMPSQDDLPEDLHQLTWQNALELSDERWEYDLNRLFLAIEEHSTRSAESSTILASTLPRLTAIYGSIGWALMFSLLTIITERNILLMLIAGIGCGVFGAIGGAAIGWVADRLIDQDMSLISRSRWIKVSFGWPILTLGVGIFIGFLANTVTRGGNPPEASPASTFEEALGQALAPALNRIMLTIYLASLGVLVGSGLSGIMAILTLKKNMPSFSKGRQLVLIFVFILISLLAAWGSFLLINDVASRLR